MESKKARSKEKVPGEESIPDAFSIVGHRDITSSRLDQLSEEINALRGQQVEKRGREKHEQKIQELQTLRSRLRETRENVLQNLFRLKLERDTLARKNDHASVEQLRELDAKITSYNDALSGPAWKAAPKISKETRPIKKSSTPQIVQARTALKRAFQEVPEAPASTQEVAPVDIPVTMEQSSGVEIPVEKIPTASPTTLRVAPPISEQEKGSYNFGLEQSDFDKLEDALRDVPSFRATYELRNNLERLRNAEKFLNAKERAGQGKKGFFRWVADKAIVLTGNAGEYQNKTAQEVTEERIRTEEAYKLAEEKRNVVREYRDQALAKIGELELQGPQAREALKLANEFHRRLNSALEWGSHVNNDPIYREDPSQVAA